MEGYFGDDFQCLYATHDNTEHVHSHILFNSVSWRTGKKYCYVAVPIVASIALCGFYSYNGMGFREVFTRYMKSIFGNKALVFQSGGYREMRAKIHAKEEALKRAAVRKAKEERKRKNRRRINEIIKKCIRKTNRKGRGKKEQIY